MLSIEQARELLDRIMSGNMLTIGAHCRERMKDRGLDRADLMDALARGTVIATEIEDGEDIALVEWHDLDGECFVLVVILDPENNRVRCKTAKGC